MPRVSVAMCTYNGTRFLRSQLRSIADQVRPPDEVVICDDQSTDGTVALIEEFAASVPFNVRLLVNESRLGSTKNFGHAIGLCDGEIIVLSDQDDVWREDKLARIHALFSRAPDRVGAMFSDADLVDSEGTPLGARLWEYFGFSARAQRRFMTGHAFEVLLRKHVILGATMALRSRFRSLILPMPDVGIHDRWISILLAAIADIETIPEPLIQYRKHRGQQAGAALASVRVAVANDQVAEQLALAQRSAANVYADYAALYELAKERLAKNQDFHCDESRLRLLDGKIAHLRVRANLPVSRLARLPVIVRELLGLRYRRYSNGIYSLAKDLVASGSPSA